MKAVIFHFDGTLANTLPVNYAGFQRVFKKFDHKDLSEKRSQRTIWTAGARDY
ncbi:HAD hydrolase-like protein [Alteribacillus sp. JSM 102045]|uniref:HAD hydrolase-like protein n=1 Tax=Alteribacillus sp. JSM 102045 TaxID=1562101 RepID=UPI0035C022D0